MSRLLADLPRRLFLGVMLGGSAIITTQTLGYFDLETFPPFIVEKLPVRFESLWLASLRIHVASALLTFPLCIVLMMRWLQRRPAWHRLLGRLTGIAVLFALVPSGVILALEAKGGPVVGLGFILSGVIVAVSMVRGVLAARRRDLVAHGRAMRHVVAQMSVAVTSRALMVGLDVLGFDPDLAYVVALWGPVLGSAAVAERVSSRAQFSKPKLVHTFSPSGDFATSQRIRREITPLAHFVRSRPVVRAVARLGR